MFILHLIAFQKSEETLAYLSQHMAGWDRLEYLYHKRVISVTIFSET